MTSDEPQRLTVARVLVDSPLPQLDRLFDYAVPAEHMDAATPGVRVKVPLRTAGRVVDGFIVEIAEAVAPERPLSELESVVSSVAVLPASLYALARRAADRAAGSASDILRLVVPKRMVRAEKAWLARPAPEVPHVDAERLRTARGILADYPTLEGALAQGARLAVDAPPRPSRLGDGTDVGAWAVLLAAAATVTLAEGRSAVLVVPDYRDQEQLLAALADLAPADAVVRDDARESGPERYAAYLRILAEAPCIVVGKRSAAYAPAARTGLVALWDDGDPLLAEPLSPGVHARDAALVRQELEGHTLLFAGHTRTTDVERLVQLGWVTDVPARRRVSPKVVLSAPDDAASRARIPSSAFAAMREGLRQGPVLVQVARPGYAPVVLCAECRRPARCLHCGGPLRADAPRGVPECGWCGRRAHGWACPHCAGSTFRFASAGTERTADELGRAFAGMRVIVADGAHPRERVDDAPALVIATRGAEPIAAGGYRAVVLLDGERMLLAEDLRIGEACLRWWANAAALALPGAPVHLVGVTGPAARALATWTPAAYARAELAERAPLRMPPTVRIVRIEGTPERVQQAVQDAAAHAPLPADALLGPVALDDGRVRALLRVDYAAGADTMRSLRASVVAAAISGRRPPKGRPPVPRNTLNVRADLLDVDL